MDSFDETMDYFGEIMNSFDEIMDSVGDEIIDAETTSEVSK